MADLATLTMDVLVSEYFYPEGENKTQIKLDLGDKCFLSFIIPHRVKVPKYIKFIAELEDAGTGS